MKEFAMQDKRPDHEGTPLQLRRWLESRGLTIEQWKAAQRLKRTAPPASLAGKPRLSIARRRQALIESLRR